MRDSTIVIAIRRLIRGFLALPALIALSGFFLAVLAVTLDRTTQLDALFDLVPFLDIQSEGARAVLTTIAGAMMTVISLVYSLTLVVFTLAAGNIGPRLLETFTDNRVNQTTIGLLGATFLYALIVLYIVGDEEVPKISVAIAILLATVSFFWVVYFVHDTARRIMVDNEIGRTQRSLRSAIDRLLAEEAKEEPDDEDAIPVSEPKEVLAERSGYVTAVFGNTLLEQATKSDGFIRIIAHPGAFVIAGAPIAYLYDGAKDIDADEIQAAVSINDARAPEGDIQFNIHLNVEIALRALSPGINDAYTAISAIDHLSASLARILQRGVPSSLMFDDDGSPRVWLELLALKDIVGAALHPLRRAAIPNMLVSLRLIEAIGRMATIADKRHAPIARKHLRLIAEDAKASVANRADRREIADAIAAARASWVN